MSILEVVEVIASIMTIIQFFIFPILDKKTIKYFMKKNDPQYPDTPDLIIKKVFTIFFITGLYVSCISMGINVFFYDTKSSPLNDISAIGMSMMFLQPCGLRILDTILGGINKGWKVKFYQLKNEGYVGIIFFELLVLMVGLLILFVGINF